MNNETFLWCCISFDDTRKIKCGLGYVQGMVRTKHLPTAGELKQMQVSGMNYDHQHFIVEVRIHAHEMLI